MRNAIKTSQDKRGWKDKAGFTLVEMAIVITIIGMVLAATAQLLQQREEWLQKENTRLAVIGANEAITAFRNTYGRYPCPASLTATANGPNAALYGVESNSATTKCADISVVAGTGIDTATGYAVVQSTPTRLVTYTDTITDVTFNNVLPRIRVGALPFKNLNLEESDSYDGYRNRILYAVTEQLAVAPTFEAEDGGITVLNDQGATIIQPADSAHFVVLSTGENGAGGFTRGGTRLACAAAGTNAETQNCDFDVDATYQLAQTTNTANNTANAFDDTISYATHADVPLWDKNPLEDNPGGPGYNDVAIKSPGNFGIGPTASETPTEDVQIEGVIIARDDPASPTLEGNVQSENICDYASGTTTCFPSSLIAGDLTLGGGMQCPPGEFMTGIQNGAPICETEVRIQCPSGLIAIGVNPDGSLNCGAPPAPGCVNANVNLCTANRTLFATNHGSTQTISTSTAPGNPGGTRSARYRCDNGSWVHESTWGDPCNCTAASNPIQTVSCAAWSACGNRFTGTQTRQAQYSCPSGTWNTVTINNSGCTCANTVRTRNRSCPPGFNDPAGIITQENRHDCAASPPACTGWLTTSNTCACLPDTDTRQINCPGGLTGTIDQERFFTCPSGSTNPGNWGAWQNVGGQPDSAFCSCVPSTNIEDRSCPTPGHIGVYQVQVDFQCPSATTVETVVTDTCAPPPPVTCSWNMLGTGGSTGGAPLPRKDGLSCTCGSPNNSCSKDLGGGVYRYGACECK